METPTAPSQRICKARGMKNSFGSPILRQNANKNRQISRENPNETKSADLRNSLLLFSNFISPRYIALLDEKAEHITDAAPRTVMYRVIRPYSSSVIKRVKKGVVSSPIAFPTRHAPRYPIDAFAGRLILETSSLMRKTRFSPL